MKNKIWIAVVLALTMSLIAGCSSTDKVVKQIASAKQIVDDDQSAMMTVDLTDGYSVEFASGAAYFYKGEPSDENEAIAFAYVISKKEYDNEIAYLTENKESKDELKNLGEGAYSYGGESSREYFFPSEDGFYMKVAIEKAALDDADSIYLRFSAHDVDG